MLAYARLEFPSMKPFSSQRLAAVLMADIAGYTRLVESDTAGTVANWQACRDRVIEPTIEQFSGQIVKLTGDGFLAEFSSVQNAVDAALTMQAQLADQTLLFRMGINLGDVIDDGKDIHGEGVNIAARIEATKRGEDLPAREFAHRMDSLRSLIISSTTILPSPEQVGVVRLELGAAGLIGENSGRVACKGVLEEERAAIAETPPAYFLRGRLRR